MTRRVPVVATVVVALAVAAMVALGVWQIQRLHWKEGLLAAYAANERRPPIAFPVFPPTDGVLFRQARGVCRRVTGWSSEAGRDARGQVGWRQIVHCATGADGPGFAVQMGVTADPDAHPAWRGGPVAGFVTHAPSHAPLIAVALHQTPPPPLMLVSDTPAPGLSPNAGPDLASVPNNHLAYAVQWFLFAIVAVVIYALALRKRWRG